MILAGWLVRGVPDEVVGEEEREVQGDVDAGRTADESTMQLHDLSVVGQEEVDIPAISSKGLQEVLGGVEDQLF